MNKQFVSGVYVNNDVKAIYSALTSIGPIQALALNEVKNIQTNTMSDSVRQYAVK